MRHKRNVEWSTLSQKMSITIAVIAMITTAVIYAGVAFLSHTYNKGGRDANNPFFAVSQWNPDKWQITGSCDPPTTPGFCVIEGMTGAYQNATHWCSATGGICIDPDTGENVKNNPIDFLATCGAPVPFCSWSQCILTFDGKTYVHVEPHPATGNPTSFILSQSNSANANSFFYMERLAVASTGIVHDQNGTIARFFFLIEGSATVYILSYTNGNERKNPITGLYTGPIFTSMNITQFTGNANPELYYFVLMEAMPASVSSDWHPPQVNPTPPVPVIARKILFFGAALRTSNPTSSELANFNDHVQKTMWINAKNYFLVIPIYDPAYSGYFGYHENQYSLVLNDAPTNILYNIEQNAEESRMFSAAKGQPFYAWIG